MANPLFSGSALPVLEQVIGFTQARHGVLAGNIANVDTPGYKTRDLSVDQFQTNLKQAIEARDQPTVFGLPNPGFTSPGLIEAAGTNGIQSFEDVRESVKSLLYHDGSDVSLETQITEISKNQSMHNLAISLMTAQFRQLEAAISERVV